MTVWNEHAEKRTVENTVFSSKALSSAFSDHAGTHVDSPVHFDSRPEALPIDQIPLERFFPSAICLDLSSAPLRHAIKVVEMEASPAASGETIRPGDPVLLYMNVNDRFLGKLVECPIQRIP